jgi:phenylpropionate dioxygenase-like ring-hydroxylating dioxygenase large terminal subunit
MGAEVKHQPIEQRPRQSSQSSTSGEVRPDLVPAYHFFSQEFLRRENDRLWPKVWQLACREEELPATGSFVTYDIADETITLVRGKDNSIRAFYNVCQHRGRRLTDGCGKMKLFRCGFHGWQWNLDGSVNKVLDRENWEGCPDFTDEDLRLKPVSVATWAGFVFVNMDDEAEPLERFLDPVPKYLDPFELQAMRYRWYVSVKLKCNWKVAIEAFNEGYHVAGTHPQLLQGQGDDTSYTEVFGRHGRFWNPNPNRPFGAPSARTGLPVPNDIRPGIIDYIDIIDQTLSAIYSPRDAAAARRLMELDPATSPMECMMKLIEFQKEAAIASGAGWPDISMQQMFEAGLDWHIFPNMVILPYADAALAYRALPHPDDPDRCTFEVYSLERFAPGTEPKLERQYFHGENDWQHFSDISPILQQDFNNMGEVQRGMKSRGFKGARTNPLQESTVSNFHRALLEFMD